MNPQNGLKIKPFKHAHQNRHKDKELQVRADGDEKELALPAAGLTLPAPRSTSPFISSTSPGSRTSARSITASCGG